MQRQDFDEEINLEVSHIPFGNQNRPQEEISASYITIHNTDNSSAGADAKAHINFLSEGGTYEHNGRLITTSWHYTVDDKRCVNHLPHDAKGWHTADKTGNENSIGIEICMNKGIDQESAFRRAEKLVACLCYDLGINPEDRVVTHQHWSGKFCPSILLSDNSPTNWESFKNNVIQIYNSID